MIIVVSQISLGLQVRFAVKMLWILVLVGLLFSFGCNNNIRHISIIVVIYEDGESPFA